MRRAALISLGLHLALLVGIILWFRDSGRMGLDAPDKLPTVELVMLEQQGSGATTTVTAPPEAAAPEPAPPPDPPVPPQAEAPPPPPPPPVDTTVASAALPLPLPSPPIPPPPAAAPPVPSPPVSKVVSSPPTPARATPPAPQAAPDAPEINLGGTDSETNAIVTGDQVIPASIDAKMRNREPVYPPDAIRRGQQGSVILLVHVSPEGLAAGVDVAKSSGYAVLDRAAREAVATWHFLPAVRSGTAIPFDMQFRIVFQLD